MRFPTRLHARLMRWRFARAIRLESSTPIFYLYLAAGDSSQGTDLDNAPQEWRSVEECLSAVAAADAPIVWLGGAEPLLHPEIGKLASALVAGGRYVFLHTNGVGLRRRIHDFTPTDRLYLCLEMPATGSLASTQEAIRVARLSGFHVCVHVPAAGVACARERAESIETLKAWPIDGIVVSSGTEGGSCDGTANAGLAEAMRLIPSMGWRAFSRALEASHQSDREQRGREAEYERPPAETEACEETAGV